MVMLDANFILRYLLNDNVEMAEKAEKCIKEGNVWTTIEIIAEVVYVLKGVYSVERKEIQASILELLDEVHAIESEVLSLGVKIYGEQNLDFVDCILYAYNRIEGYGIKTFDKKLVRLLKMADTDL